MIEDGLTGSTTAMAVGDGPGIHHIRVEVSKLKLWIVGVSGSRLWLWLRRIKFQPRPCLSRHQCKFITRQRLEELPC